MNTNRLRIAIADDEPDMRDFFVKILRHLGHEVAIVAANGAELVRLCREAPPELIITDIAMPELDGLAAVREICRERPLPVILVSGHHDDELIQRALHEQVLAYLVKPITRDQLQPAIALAMRRYREFEALRHQAHDLRQALEDRKVIERAKGVLMTRGGLTEPDAFRRLQKLSSEKNQKMAEIARMIVTTEEALAT